MTKKKLYSRNGIVYSTAANFTLQEETEPAETLAPKEQLLKIKLDTKHRRGKVVTIVSGALMKEKEMENLAKQLKSLCGSGGSVKDGDIIIQGDHREKIIEWLLKNGYNKARKV